MKILHWWVIFSILLLSACGFQLRGQVDMPEGLDTVYIRAPEVLKNELEVFLQANSVEISKIRKEADAVISMQKERFDQRVLSVDPKTGRSQEFELTYSVEYSFARKDGSVLVEPRVIRLVRDYFFDPETLLGKSSEASTLRKEMRRDSVRELFRRLQHARRG